MPVSLKPFEEDLIEEFGNMYESYGWSRLKGLLIGLLIVRNDPTSLSEMTEFLGRSKGPISSTIRELSKNNLVKKVRGPENRRDYYQIDPNVFYNNFLFNMAAVRKNMRIADNFLSQARDNYPSSSPVVRNLESMQAFYEELSTVYTKFSQTWKKKQS